MGSNPLGEFGFSVEVDEAAETEALGFGTLWLPGGRLRSLDLLTEMLAATHTAKVGSAIIPPDLYRADAVTRLYARAESIAPGRFMVGLGIAQEGRPVPRLMTYLDELDAVPTHRRLLAALGPRALGIARERCAGAMPMLLTPEQVVAARAALGPDAILAVGLYAVLDSSARTARAAARETLGFLTNLGPYARSLARQGFSRHDMTALSDRLVDSLVAWGEPDTVIEHARKLHVAGADHVAFTVLGRAGQPTGVTAARLLAMGLPEFTALPGAPSNRGGSAPATC